MSNSSGRLAGKVAIITGGARGIGKASVVRFVNEGAKVAIWDLLEEQGQALAADLGAQGFDVAFFKVNIADYANVEAALKQTVERFGTVDILINNAGITRDKTLLKMSSEQWQQVIDVNLTGVFNCTKLAAEIMVAKGFGRIINTSSVVALYGNVGQTNYVATKAAIIGMTKTWAKELGKKGVTVNAVAPGYVATEMIDSVPSMIIEAVKFKTPLSRLGEPDDIANAYLFLASDEAGYINGHVLSVDGGMTI